MVTDAFQEVLDSELDFGDVDPTTIPESTQLPLGTLVLEVKGAKEGDTGPAKRPGEAGYKAGRADNRKTVAIQFVVAEVEGQEDFVGIPYTKTFYVGTDQDPKAKHSAWFEGDAVRLMNMIRKSGTAVERTSRLPDLLLATIGNRVQGDVTVSKGRARPDMPGERYPDRNEVSAWHKVGDKPVRIVGDTAAVSFGASAPRKPKTFAATD